MGYDIRHPYSSLTVGVLRKYPNPLFIETGTNVGHGVQTAIEAGFPHVCSIEQDLALHQLCVERFAGVRQVNLVHNSSPAGLFHVLQKVPIPATIYLDAHGGGTTPLLSELTAILRSGWKDLTIMIDDVRMFGTPEWGGVTLVEAITLLNLINPDYTYKLEPTTNGPADLLVAFEED